MVLATRTETQQCNEINKTFPVINIVGLMETMSRHTMCVRPGTGTRNVNVTVKAHVLMTRDYYFISSVFKR